MTEYRLSTPVSEEDIRTLRAGDTLYLSGTMITARDEAHHRALEFAARGEAIPVEFRGKVVYHCGPLVRKEDGRWSVVSAGPTTSTRLELFEDRFIEEFQPRVVVGKGGMGPRTTQAMEKFGCVYGSFTGGAGALAAKSIKNVADVLWLDLGVPEALWVLDVEGFGPLSVTIDSHGRNLYLEVSEQVRRRKEAILERLS